MDSLFRTSQSNIALCVFKQMKSPDLITSFKTSLCHLSRLNDITNISHVLRLMLSIPHYLDESTFNEVLNSFCKTKDAMSPQVYQLWGLKVKLGIDFSDNFFTLLIYKYYKLQRFDEATKLFVEMLQTDCSDHAAIKSYTTLVRSSLASNNVDAALHLFNLMLSEGFKPYQCFYGGILVALIDVPGRERDVLELVCKVREIESRIGSTQMDNPMYL
jgi:pentatricopeptide repeat protein